MKLKYERTRTLENTQCRTLGNNQIEEQMFKITYIIALSSEIYYKISKLILIRESVYHTA